MAAVVLAGIAPALSLILQEPIADQFRRDVVLFNLLDVRQGRNEALTYGVKMDARTAGGAYSEGEDMEDADFDSHKKFRATAPWAQYRKGAKVSGLAEAVSASMGGGVGGDGVGYAGGVSAILEELEDAIDSLTLDLGTDLYAGDPSDDPAQLGGLAMACSAANGTFYGIDNTQANRDSWRGNAQTHVGALTIGTIRSKLIRPIKDASGERPWFITCAPDLWDQVSGLADTLRLQRSGIVRTLAGPIDIEAILGQQSIVVDGVPIIEDRHATANTMYGLNPKHVRIDQIVPNVLPRDLNASVVTTVLRSLTGADIQVGDVEQRLRAMRNSRAMVPVIERLDKSGDADKFMVKAYAQVRYRRRNGLGKLTVTPA